jgi:hypothetical protein
VAIQSIFLRKILEKPGRNFTAHTGVPENREKAEEQRQPSVASQTPLSSATNISL